MKKMTHNESGYIALITIIIVGAILTTIAVFLLLTGVGSSQYGRGVEANAQAKAAAGGCAELALAAIQANTSLTTPFNSSLTIDATKKSTCSYTISGTTPNYTIDAVGAVDQTGTNYVHRTRVILNQVVPQLTYTSWQDIP